MLRHLTLRVMVLMLFVVSQTPILPATAALAVWLDGSHKVEFTAGSDGLTLLLRHQRKLGQNDNALPQGHQHGLLTRAVLSFAQSQGGTHPDHKLSFKSATNAIPKITQTIPTPGTLQLQWTSDTTGWLLQQSTDLATWTNSTAIINTIGSVSTTTINGVFYRLAHP